jgi:Protein of unknown function (DUF1615)
MDAVLRCRMTIEPIYHPGMAAFNHPSASREAPHSLPTRLATGRGRRLAFTGMVTLLLVACAGEDPYRMPPRSPESIRADIANRIPTTVSNRAAWASDIHGAFVAMNIAPSTPNICAVLAVIEQESTYNADPAVPNLAKISREEIFRRAERAGAPAFGVTMALQLKSPTGKTYDERLAAVKTEQDLSLMYEDFINEVPLGKQLFEGYNPVHTAGPMQVSIGYAEQHSKVRPYPHAIKTSLRHEVFTRRGGLHFGIAHLLDYPAPYGEQMIYRFADFNAGQLASRNAAFQNAVAVASGIKLDLDGDLVPRTAGKEGVGQTEAATILLAPQLGMDSASIRAALASGEASASFNDSKLYTQVFVLAARKAGRDLPRAVVPKIVLQSPKITRKLTTEWFAQRVDARYQQCLGRNNS